MAAGEGGPPAAATLTLLLSVGASVPGLLRGHTAARSAAALRPAALRAGEGERGQPPPRPRAPRGGSQFRAFPRFPPLRALPMSCPSPFAPLGLTPTVSGRFLESLAQPAAPSVAPLWASPVAHAAPIAPPSLGASPEVPRSCWAPTSPLCVGLHTPSAPISALDTMWTGVRCWELEEFAFLRP